MSEGTPGRNTYKSGNALYRDMAATITLKKIYDELQELKASVASKDDLDALLVLLC